MKLSDEQYVSLIKQATDIVNNSGGGSTNLVAVVFKELVVDFREGKEVKVL